MTTNDIATIASQISNHVKLFHSNPTAERARSEILEKFQHSQQALQVSSYLLQDVSQSDYVLNFAAHTIVQKVQSRTVPFSVDFGPSLLILIGQYGSSSKHASITKMLCQGYVDFVLMNYEEAEGAMLAKHIAALPPHCAVVIYTLLPEEARSGKLFPKGSKRAELYNSVISNHSGAALEAIQAAGVSRESLQALKTWIRVQRFSLVVRMRRTWGDTYSCSEIVKALPSMSIFRQSLSALHNPAIPLGTAELCSEIVAESLRLTNDPTEDLEFIVSIGEAICELGKALSGSMPAGTEAFLAEQSAQDTQLVGRIRLFCVLMSEFALVHYIPILLRLLNGDESSGVPPLSASLRSRAQGVIQSVSESGLHFVGIRHHEIAMQALDFWYNLLSSMLGATDVEDDEDELFVGLDDNTSSNTSGGFGARSMHLAKKLIGDDEVDEVGPVIAPFFKRLLPTLVQAMCFPTHPETDENFDSELFTQFRELAANVLSEACEIVDPLWMIQLVGESLSTLLPNSANNWQGIEACIHVLTAVAPRLPAGGDPVIPMMLENVTRLYLPERGQPAVLMRGALGRLVLYTSAYLSNRVELCLQIVSYICGSILPFLSSPAARQGVPVEVLNSAQSACAQAVKMALHSARRQIIGLPQAQIGGILEQSFLGSALDEKLSLDSRLQIVRGVGSVMSELGNWTLIKQTLSAFALKAGQLAQAQLEQFSSGPAPNNPNAMGPASVKVYISLLSSISSLPDDPSLLAGGTGMMTDQDKIQALNHPVLAVLAEQWSLVEQICRTVGCAYSDIAQVMATSFVQIFAHTRAFASHSIAFLPALRIAAQCFLTRPISDWMHMVRSFVSMFGEYTRVDHALVETLCQLSETFVKHSAEILTSNTEMKELTFDEARMVAETFEVLSEVLRFVDLASVELKQVWFRPIAIVAVQCLFDAPVDSRTLPAMVALLRFTERLTTWIDPPPVIHAAADTELVCFETAACVRGWLQEKYYNPSRRASALQTVGDNNLIDTLIVALANMWAVKSSEFPQVLPSTSTSLRISLNSSLGAQVAGRLQKHAETEWLAPQLIPGDRLRSLFAQMDQCKRDSRGFGRIISDMAKEFHAASKRALFNQ